MWSDDNHVPWANKSILGVLSVIAATGCGEVDVLPTEQRDVEAAEPSPFSRTCEQLDFDGSGTIDFADHLILSALFGTEEPTPTGFIADFALFVEFSQQFGATCEQGLRAPLLFSPDQIEAAAIPTIFEALSDHDVELSDQEYDAAFDTGLFGRLEPGQTAMHPGEVIEVGEGTYDAVAEHAASYNESGLAFQLREFEGLVAQGLFIPGDPVHESLREAYNAARSGVPLPQIREAHVQVNACAASCGLWLAPKPLKSSAVAGATCQRPTIGVRPELEAQCDVFDDTEDLTDESTMAYARTSCVADTMVGIHCVFSPGCEAQQHCEADFDTHSGESIKAGSINDDDAQYFDPDDGPGEQSGETYAKAEALAWLRPIHGPTIAPVEMEGWTEARHNSCDLPYELAEYTYSMLDGPLRAVFADLMDNLLLPSWTIDWAYGTILQAYPVPEDMDTCTGTTLSRPNTVHYLASRSTDSPLPCGEGHACEHGLVCTESTSSDARGTCVPDPSLPEQRNREKIFKTRAHKPLATMGAEVRARVLAVLPAFDEDNDPKSVRSRAFARARSSMEITDLAAFGLGTQCSYWALGDERYDALYDRAVFHRGAFAWCATTVPPNGPVGKASKAEACQMMDDRDIVGCD